MIKFSTLALMDNSKCYEYLVKIFHPRGLHCPRCDLPVEEARVHRRDRAPIFYYRCPCKRIYNAFAGTDWQDTRHSCSMIVCILQGFAQGVSTKHLAEELGIDRNRLLIRRHKIQRRAEVACLREPLTDKVTEVDEMYQNAGEKRRTTR